MCEREPSGFPFTYSINFLEHFEWSKKCLILSKKSKGDFFDRIKRPVPEPERGVFVPKSIITQRQR